MYRKIGEFKKINYLIALLSVFVGVFIYINNNNRPIHTEVLSLVEVIENDTHVHMNDSLSIMPFTNYVIMTPEYKAFGYDCNMSGMGNLVIGDTLRIYRTYKLDMYDLKQTIDTYVKSNKSDSIFKMYYKN
jgi:hypothetical protein